MSASEPSKKHAQILDASVDVIGNRGFYEASVSEIARKAGVATGTVYNYFERKEDLLVEVFRKFLGDHVRAIRSQLSQDRPGRAQLETLCYTHLKRFEDNRSLAAVLHIHWREVQPIIRVGILPALLSWFDTIAKMLEDGVAAGEFSSGIDVRQGRILIVGALDEAVTSWVMAGTEHPLSQDAPGMAAMFDKALS